jgi:hypothetical protein
LSFGNKILDKKNTTLAAAEQKKEHIFSILKEIKIEKEHKIWPIEQIKTI